VIMMPAWMFFNWQNDSSSFFTSYLLVLLFKHTHKQIKREKASDERREFCVRDVIRQMNLIISNG
jgi:hypothetical protein